MKTIPYPKPGEKITADLIRDILDLIREITPVAGPNIRTTRTNHGTHISAIAPHFASSNPSNDLGCFRLVMKSKDESRPDGDVKVTYLTVENRYFSIGEVSRHMDEGQEINLYDYINQGALPTGLEYTDADRPFICLKVGANIGYDGHFPEPEIVAYKDFDEVTAAQRDTNFVIRPLYKLTHAGAVAVDFRTMPHVQMVEVI